LNLLEIVADLSNAAHAAKDMIARQADRHEFCTCNDDYCRAEIPPGVVVFRGSDRVAAMTLSTPKLSYALTVAARMFRADAIGIAVDGRDKYTDRPMVVTVGVNRAGDELWRVEPYSLAPDGRTVIWWPAEVPDQHPLLEPSGADEFVNLMNRSTMPWPPMLDMYTPGMSFEQRQACIDIGITKQVARHGHKPYANIAAVSLCAVEGTERQRLLDMAGDNPALWV
jgi:hypothetical protein